MTRDEKYLEELVTAECLGAHQGCFQLHLLPFEHSNLAQQHGSSRMGEEVLQALMSPKVDSVGHSLAVLTVRRQPLHAKWS